MSNRFNIHLDTPLNIPMIKVRFNGGEVIELKNHADTTVDIEPGRYTINAVYSLYFGESQMDYNKTIETVVDGGFDYEAKICMVLKIFSFLKIYGRPTACC